jgi:hypothetical protein
MFLLFILSAFINITYLHASTLTDSLIISESDYVDSQFLLSQINSFLFKLDSNQDILNIILTGQSISDFQISELTIENPTTIKTNRTIEPNGLYGNTFGRNIWKLFNYNVYPDTGPDPELINFKDDIPQAIGNIHFLRADNPNLVKTGNWFFSGEGYTSESNLGKFIDTNTAIGKLGGWNDTFDNKYFSNAPYPYTKVYFFTKDINNYCQLIVPPSAIGFSVVCFGRRDGYFDDKSGNILLPSNNIEVKINGTILDNIDLTSFNGQKHFDYKLNRTDVSNLVTITNKANQRWANLWGVEYWDDKCVRLINNSFSATSPIELYDNWDYIFVNNKPDLIIFDNFNRSAELDSLNMKAQYNILNKIKSENISPVFCIIDPPLIGDYSVQMDSVGAQSFIFNSLKVICDSLNIPYINMHKKFIALGQGTGYRSNSTFQNYFKDRVHLSLLGEEEINKTLKYVFRPNDITGIKSLHNNLQIPNNFILYQNYPNPFNPITKIKFTIPEKTKVKLEVYNILGKRIKTLVNEELKKGNYEKSFNGEDYSSGIYIYRLLTEKVQISKKLLLLK